MDAAKDKIDFSIRQQRKTMVQVFLGKPSNRIQTWIKSIAEPDVPQSNSSYDSANEMYNFSLDGLQLQAGTYSLKYIGYDNRPLGNVNEIERNVVVS